MSLSAVAIDRALSVVAPSERRALDVPPAVFGGTPLYDTMLPIARPTLPPPEELLDNYRTVIESGRLTNGALVHQLEHGAAAYLGVPECVAVSSCTAGLMLVERCLDLQGKVLVPSFTFFATAHSLLWNNLEPVLVDCDRHTFNIDPERIARALHPGVSAILAVHIYGNPADAAELERIASRAGVRLLFDAAHAFGARRDGRPVGASGDAEIFSLSPTKLLVAGEGGLIATRNRKLAAALRAARNYGDSGDYDCRFLGLNARMTEFQAALGVAGLKTVDEQVERRNRLARVYERILAPEPGLTLQQIHPNGCATRKDFSIVIDEEKFGVTRRFLQLALDREKVQVRRYFDPPLHRQRLYSRFYRPDLDPLETTERISNGVLTLPLHSYMTEQEVERLARRILAIRDWVVAIGRPRSVTKAAP